MFCQGDKCQIFDAINVEDDTFQTLQIVEGESSGRVTADNVFQLFKKFGISEGKKRFCSAELITNTGHHQVNYQVEQIKDTIYINIQPADN
jgi:ribosomal protein L9